MMEIETDFDRRLDDVDVESILARVEQRPLIFARKRCLYQAPEFVKRLPAEETVEEGTMVSFSCKIVGFPKPTVTWYKDDDVIGNDTRAKLDVDENIHSICLKDVSKCDGGTYRCKAVNLEGSSANNLYVSVKARTRNRKKKKARIVTAAPPFPAIVEKVAEENRETLEVELQPESPLTPLYCNISLKSPVSWPAFLGEWAYCMEMTKQDDEDLEMGSEDVFDDEDDIQTTLNFDNSKYNSIDNVDNTVNHGNVDNIVDLNRNCVISKTVERDKRESNLDKETVDIALNANEVASRFRETLKHLPDIVIGKDSNEISDTGQKPKQDPFRDKIGDMKDNKNTDDSVNNNTAKPVAIPPKTLDLKPKTEFKSDDSSVSRISVNRSYAKGESTFSVATRSSSPYPPDFKKNLKQNESKENLSALRNKNNGATEKNLKTDSVCLTRSSPDSVTWDDHVLEIVLMISGSTFLGLCFDLPPWLFMLYVFVALLIREIVGVLLAEFRKL